MGKEHMMMKCVNRISIDTESLPNSELFGKLFPIIKKRIEDRCGASCCENDTGAQFVLRFILDESVPAEGFRLIDEDGVLAVRGADFLALMYGAGQFLHKSRYTAEGIVPTQWRGLSVPQKEKRMIQFCQHFFNWYQRCTAEEIQEHIEDLVLWGINGVVSVFTPVNSTGWDDPTMKDMTDILRTCLKAAKELSLKVGMEFSNVDFMNPRKELAADYKYLLSTTGNLICTSTEEGYAYFEELLGKAMSYTDDIGLDFITFIAYDEGGCCCDKCWPWGGKGYYNMTHRASKFLRERYPNIEVWLFTWYLGRTEHQRMSGTCCTAACRRMPPRATTGQTISFWKRETTTTVFIIP